MGGYESGGGDVVGGIGGVVGGCDVGGSDVVMNDESCMDELRRYKLRFEDECWWSDYYCM